MEIAQVNVSHPNIEGDDDLIRRATGAKNGAKFQSLWLGGWSGYGSQSEADLALCSQLHFWTGGDLQRMDHLFWESGLMRPKCEERHGAQTYGEMTVAKACSGTVIAPTNSADQKN